MKKTFALKEPGKADARVLDAIKHDVRKYVKRERRKTLPEGFSVWRFDCKVGANAATAIAKDLKEISGALDAIAQSGGTEVYVEILAAADHQRPGIVATPDAP